MANAPTPKTSPNERYLRERAKRYAEPLPALLVRLHTSPTTCVQFPDEVQALATIIHRQSTPVGDLNAVPNSILSENLEADAAA